MLDAAAPNNEEVAPADEVAAAWPNERPVLAPVDCACPKESPVPGVLACPNSGAAVEVTPGACAEEGA